MAGGPRAVLCLPWSRANSSRDEKAFRFHGQFLRMLRATMVPRLNSRSTTIPPAVATPEVRKSVSPGSLESKSVTATRGTFPIPHSGQHFEGAAALLLTWLYMCAIVKHIPTDQSDGVGSGYCRSPERVE